MQIGMMAYLVRKDFKMLWKKRKDGKEKKKKDKKGFKPKDLLKISSNKILIKVYKHFGSNVSFLKAKYEAIERRDSYDNLVSINDQYRHNEDTDFTIDDVYREIEIVLEFKNMGRDDKLDLLNKKINYQEKLLNYLKKFPELNSVFNYADEDIKTRDYKLLRNFIKNHDGQGAYFSIEDGLRVYSFESVDGFLVPIWHGVDTYSQYPDHTRKKKITIQEDQIMRREMALFNRDKIVGNILVWGLVFNIILFSILIFSGYKVWDKNNNMESRIQDQAIQCVSNIAEIENIFSESLNEQTVRSLVTSNKQIESETKELNPDVLQ